MNIRTIKFLLILILLLFCDKNVILSDNEKAKITYLEGTVKVKDTKTKKFNIIKKGYKLFPGDIVRCDKNSRAEIKFFDKSIIRLNQYSEFEIKSAERKKESKETSISLVSNIGGFWVRIKGGMGYTTDFKVDTPTALIGVRSTTYRAQIDEDKKTMVRVYKGKVEVKTWIEAYQETIKVKPRKDDFEKEKKEEIKEEIEGPYEVEGPIEVTIEEWMRLVGEMQQVIISPDKMPEDVSTFDPEEDEKDEWVRWNKERDKVEEESE